VLGLGEPNQPTTNPGIWERKKMNNLGSMMNGIPQPGPNGSWNDGKKLQMKRRIQRKAGRGKGIQESRNKLYIYIYKISSWSTYGKKM